MMTNENTQSASRALAADALRATLISQGTADHEIPCVLGVEHNLPDDVQITSRASRAPAEHIAQWSLEPCPQAARRARALVRVTLALWGREALTDDAELLISELTTNAARHASHSISLRLILTGHLRCEVYDDDHTLPVPRHVSPTDESGRGLYLVQRLGARWGSSHTDTGKVVWFELSTPYED